MLLLLLIHDEQIDVSLTGETSLSHTEDDGDEIAVQDEGADDAWR